MFELLKTILIGVGVLVAIWILLMISWTFAIAITESHFQSVTDGSLVKKYEALRKKFNCKFQRSNFVRDNAEDYTKTEDPKLKELSIASYFDCKGVIRTLEDLMAIKDPQDGDQYLFFNQDETVDNYIHNPRKFGNRFRYWNGNWYIDLLRIDISERDKVSVNIKYFVIGSDKLVL